MLRHSQRASRAAPGGASARLCGCVSVTARAPHTLAASLRLSNRGSRLWAQPTRAVQGLARVTGSANVAIVTWSPKSQFTRVVQRRQRRRGRDPVTQHAVQPARPASYRRRYSANPVSAFSRQPEGVLPAEEERKRVFVAAPGWRSKWRWVVPCWVVPCPRGHDTP